MQLRTMRNWSRNHDSLLADGGTPMAPPAPAGRRRYMWQWRAQRAMGDGGCLTASCFFNAEC